MFSGEKMSLVNITVHAVNGIYVLVDGWVSALPVRLLHFWHSSVMLTIYGLFTIVYFLAGGMNGNSPYIYTMIKYDTDLGVAVAWLLAILIVIAPLLHSFMFFNYLLRERFYQKCFSQYRAGVSQVKHEEQPLQDITLI